MWLLGLQMGHAQITNGLDTLYGNEWVRYDLTWYKINVVEDGIYRVATNALSNAGVPVASVPGSDWRLFHNGVQVPLYTSTNDIFGATDFIEFFGEKNRSQIEQHLFAQPDEGMVNPWYSMFSDTGAYYLAAIPTLPAQRYTPLNNNLTNLPPAETWCWRTNTTFFKNAYLKREIGEDIIYSWFNGDGFASAPNVTTTQSLTLNELFTNGPSQAQLRIRYGANQNEHRLSLQLNNTEVAKDSFFNWKLFDRSFQVPVANLGSPLSIKLEGQSSPIDRGFIAGYEMRYPATFNFSGQEARFSLEADAQDKYLEINGLNTNNGAPVLYDLTNNIRVQTELSGNTVRARLNGSGSERQIMVVTPNAGIRSITSLVPVQFRDYASEPDADYIIISNKKLLKDPQNNGANYVEEYANYRRSFAGGSHTVAVVDVKELYEQFGFGLANNPLAIANFCHYIKKEWSSAAFLLFIGKGLEYQSLRANGTLPVFTDSLHHVPMFGYPATDQPFVMDKGKVSNPLMAIGRLAVTRPAQIRDYLNKVRDFEAEQASGGQTAAEKAWMKRVIHASGGTVNDAATIRYYSDDMANVIRNNRFGADVRRFYKVSNDPVQTAAFDEIKSLVNEGVSMWMVFGHSAPTVIDYDIGTAGNYNNRPRYPFLMIMGCFTGTCSLPVESIGEDYVLTADRGSIAYTASVYYGFTDALNTYGKGVYNQLGGDSYGKSLGEAMQKNIVGLKNSQNPSLVALMHQYTLQGDPAVKIQTAPGPDYILDPQSVKHTPNPVPTDAPTYDLKFDVLNIGENVPGTFTVKVDEVMPDNTVKTIVLDTVAAPALRSTLQYTINNENAQTGYHKFLFQADIHNNIAELPAAAELNNKLLNTNGAEGVEVYFYSNDVQPAFPPDFAILPKKEITLSASALGTPGNSVRYLFELDTIETFNSPFKRNTEFVQAGGLMQWKQELDIADSTVVYWRVARDSIVDGQIPWKTSSFVYIEGSNPGWNQSDFGQYNTNTLANMSGNTDERDIEFAENNGNLLMRINYRDGGTFPGFINSFNQGVLSNFRLTEAGFSSGIGIMVINPETGRVVWNPPGGPYNPAPSDRRKFFFYFNPTDSVSRINLMEFLKNEVPDQAVVGMLVANPSWDSYGYAPELWAKDSVSYGKNLFQVLEENGAQHVRQLLNYPNVPPAYGFIYKKNDAAFEPIDTIMDVPGEFVEIRGLYKAPWYTGEMASRKIGPAKAWRSLHFQPAPKDDLQDELELLLYGIRADQSDTLLMQFSAAADTALTAVSVADFPYLRLSYHAYDTVRHTATPLRHVRVLYEPVPEGALNPLALFEFSADTLEQGDQMTAKIAFANISNADFDTLLVRYRVENQAGNNIVVEQKLQPLVQGDTVHASVRINTANLSGEQRLLIDVNPDENQPELYHFNNVAFRPFYVSRDRRNPLLDVTFDGNRLLDGDLISPKPEIMIRLADDNPFLAMSDTALFDMTLRYPDNSTRTIFMNDPGVLFMPANPANLDKKNEARIEWRPIFEQDGDYELSVQGRDVSGNTSAAVRYSIRFRVITKSSISNLLNYPNPFSTSSCFYYTMTGAETPTQFKLQIMTVAGKIVREVTEAEFGPLQAGTHQSQFCWDGRDEFGDQLANGVYLYRVSAKKQDGTPFEFYETTSIDGFFKNGIGKMVLMR